MGISGFINQLKKNFEPSSNWFKNNKEKQYDYLFFDYQSMFYSTYEIFSSEINYFLRLIFFIKYNAKYKNENISNKVNKGVSYENILIYIYDKYIDFFKNFNTVNKEDFLPNSKDSIPQLIDKIDKIFKLNLNDKPIILDTLAFYIVRQTENISNDIIKDEYSNKIERTFIFFDGIPSLSKIKEQLTRRVSGRVTKNIINSIYNKDTLDELSLIFLYLKLLPTNPPSIGINSEIVLKVKKMISDKGYFVNSSERINKYGEAEHQMMKYIIDKKFLESDILISSPDADLILLIFIKRTMNFRIDLLKQTANTELKINRDNAELPFEYVMSGRDIISPYNILNEFIIIDNLLSAMRLLRDGVINNQSIIDISFILLLLGDDFIPIISTMDIYKLDDILTVYHKLRKVSDYKIINFDHTYKINFENLKIYIRQLSKKESSKKWKSFPKALEKTITEANQSIKKLEKTYFYNEIKNKEFNIQNFKTSYYFEKSGLYYNPGGDLNFSLLEKKKESSSITDAQYQNYLEGYSFILDIYFNNSLKNYRWIYDYKKAPSLTQLDNFLRTKNDECVLRELFDYTKKNKKDTYLDTITYLQFTNNNQSAIIKNLLRVIMIKKSKFSELDDLNDESKLDELCKKYFIYDIETLNILFNCDGERYINKCVDIEKFIPVPLSSEYERPIDTTLLGGYYQKYLKYKNKYMSLKNKII